VVNKMSSLRKISFLAHSLGGLFARYAIAVLHSVETKNAGQSSALIVPTTSDESRILSKGIPSKNFHIQFDKFISAIR